MSDKSLSDLEREFFEVATDESLADAKARVLGVETEFEFYERVFGLGKTSADFVSDSRRGV